MNDKIMNMSVMNIKQTVERANATGINISEYTLRRAIRTRQLPCKVIGRKNGLGCSRLCIPINISEYTLRRAIRTRQLPCKVIGRTYLIPWDGFLRWVNCEQ